MNQSKARSKSKIQIVQSILRWRFARFLLCGVVTAAFNVLIIAVLIESLQLNKPFLQNLANLIAIEISLLFSFGVYRTFVWNQNTEIQSNLIKPQILKYHLSCGFVVAFRGLLLFPLLNWMGMNYVLNTLVGIVISFSMNYMMSDRWVFKTKTRSINK